MGMEKDAESTVASIRVPNSRKPSEYVDALVNLEEDAEEAGASGEFCSGFLFLFFFFAP
jgi:hypothetical protein